MPNGRPPGPIRKYTVSCAWPTHPKRFRVTVDSTDEATARESVAALLRMHFSVQIVMAFFKANRTNECLGRCTAARWDQSGNVTDQHLGEFHEYIPGWITGREPVEREKPSEPVLAGS